MNVFRLNIENRVLFLAAGTILLWVVCSLTTLNAWNRIGEAEEVSRELARCHEDLTLFVLLGNENASRPDQVELAAAAGKLKSSTEVLRAEKSLSRDARYAGPVSTVSKTADALVDLLYAAPSEEGTASPDNQASADLIDLSVSYESALKEISAISFEETASLRSSLRRRILILLLGGFLVLTSLFALFAHQLSTSLRRLQVYIGKLSRGEIPEKLQAGQADETGQIALMLNRYTESMCKKIAYLEDLSKGNLHTGFRAEEKDLLGKALEAFEEKLRQSVSEEQTRAAEEKRRSWTTEGLALFGEILGSERENVSELSFRIIHNLVTYMKIEMGTLFLSGITEDTGERYLEIEASYAFDRRKYLQRRVAWGESLPGTCALEKEKIFLTSVPEDYFEVSSGLGSIRPSSILLVPLNLEGEIFGIIELASVRVMETHEVQFVETLAQSIASTLSAVRNSEKTALLLRQSQQQAEELLQKDERMKSNMKELEMTQVESQKKASEITGILNAINHSSLVAEFAVNGRFISLNDKFLLLLESPQDQVLGKHHSEFAMVDKYGEEYKAFWTSLKNGETVPVQGRYKLFSGKEIWLQETFTPILNSEGKVYKILDIAVDITRTVEQQEVLKNKTAEITRQALDFSSLNEAVNSSIIKCELDPDGIIINLNENFLLSSGYNRKELLGRNYRLFLREIETEQFERIWQEIKKEKTYQGVIRRTRPTGEEVWLMATFSPVKNEEGMIYKIYFLALDITEKKLKYQLLEDANREIDRLKERLSFFSND